jgi:hypothetical protein
MCVMTNTSKVVAVITNVGQYIAAAAVALISVAAIVHVSASTTAVEGGQAAIPVYSPVPGTGTYSTGGDMLALDYSDEHADLWASLLDDGAATEQDAEDGRIYVPLNTMTTFDDGFYWATADGWYWCPRDADMCTYVEMPDLPADQTATVDQANQATDYGAGAGAVCGTDAECAAWSRAHGEEPSGYAAGKS